MLSTLVPNLRLLVVPLQDHNAPCRVAGKRELSFFPT